MEYIPISKLCNCVNCGKDYDVEYAEIHLKGNKWFCSAKCVLEYDQNLKNGKIPTQNYTERTVIREKT